MWACYGIGPKQLRRSPKLSINDVYFAASLIYERCLIRHMPKHAALAQITTANIAAIVCPWDNPLAEASDVARVIKESLGEDILHYTNEIRKITFESHHDKPLRVNLQDAVKRWEISYSESDLQRGVKIPYMIGSRELFLLGVYFAVGWFDGNRDRFLLGTTKNNRELMKSTVIPLVYDLFNIQAGSNIRERVSEATGEESYESLDIYIDSKAHATFLREHFSFYTVQDGGHRIYMLPTRLPGLEGMTMCDAMIYFLAGAIAAKGNVGRYRYDRSPEISFQNKNKSYLETLEHAATIAGFDSYSESKGDTQKIAFRKRALDAMLTLEFTSQDLLFDPMRGIIVNPVHLEKLAKYKPSS